MSTEMKNVDVFSLPDDVCEDLRRSNKMKTIILELDLHDNYDFLSQPLGPVFSFNSRGNTKDESR